ncbi:MAG: hypothetical protein ABIO92_02880 [Chloroflexia bacterium]
MPNHGSGLKGSTFNPDHARHSRRTQAPSLPDPEIEARTYPLPTSAALPAE